jgi:hypothetical protein
MPRQLNTVFERETLEYLAEVEHELSRTRRL